MNLISDCCFGAYVYRDYLKIEYQNPFIWSSILLKDMASLIKNYAVINFSKVKLIRFRDHVSTDFFCGDKFMLSQYNTLTGLEVDGKFKVFWTHNYYDPTATVPKKLGGEVYYCKNYLYTVNNWFKRMPRMANAGKPVFSLITQKNKFGTVSEYKQLLNECAEADIIMITSTKELLEFNTKHHRIYFNADVDRSPEFILREMYKDINFIF